MSSEGFYKAIKNSGNMLQNAWDKVSGISMLKERGIAPKSIYSEQAAMAFAGMFGGVMCGVAIGGIVFDSKIIGMLIMGAGASLPVTYFLPYSIYKSGEHDYAKRIAQEKLKQLEAPKPQLPPPPSGLI